MARDRGTAGARAGSGGGRKADRRSGHPRPGADDRVDAQPGLTGAQLAALRTRLRVVVEPVVMDADLDLEEFTIARAGRRFVVRVMIDGESGVGHNELSDVSRAISAALDEAEESGGEFAADSYTLEVSSPGVDRVLTLPRHWRRNVGRLVKVTAGSKSLTARVLGVDDDGVQFEGVDGPISFAELGGGRVQIEFTRLAELSDEDIGEEFDGDEDDEEDDDDGEEDDDHEDDDEAGADDGDDDGAHTEKEDQA